MKVHELLAEEKNWTMGTFARDAEGITELDFSDKAVCWCLLGAIFRCYGNSPIASGIIARIQNRLQVDSVAAWNDSHTYQDVITLARELDV